MHREAFRFVFSRPRYVALSLSVFAALLVALSYLAQYVFFSPSFVFYVQPQQAVDFSLVVAVAILSAIVVSMSICRVRMQGLGARRSGVGFLGSVIGAGAGACGCSSVGFSVISAFGTAGGMAMAFLTNYSIPLRLVSIAILGYAYYTSVRGISGRCGTGAIGRERL
ncbi:MAG: hypothetical protein KGI33_12115 [Thaumarchaeota archaeon]|nr:hypothetical protein [Nitrososphaerota archaeon]